MSVFPSIDIGSHFSQIKPMKFHVKCGVLPQKPTLLNTRFERQGKINIKLKDTRAQNGTAIALNSETSHASSATKLTAYGSPLRSDGNCGEPTATCPK